MSKLCYAKDRLKTIYFCKPDLPFEDSLVPIKSDAEVRELIRLLTNLEYVYVYVEHIDNDKAEREREGIRGGMGLKLMIILQMMTMNLLMGSD